MEKQTAVEWLITELSKPQYPEDIKKICDKAIEMEKQQIINAVNQTEFTDIDGLGISETITKGEQYYEQLKQRK